MKTIEQKALAYDEAIRKAKKLYEKGTIIESIGYIFPEIEKSEDERIRKALLNEFIHLQSKGYKFAGLEGEEIIAWLVKQGSVEEIVERCKKSWYNEGKIDGKFEGIADDVKYQQGWHDAIEKQVPVDKDKVVKGVKRGVATSLINYIDANSKGMCLSNMECEDIDDAIVNGKWYKVYNYMKKKLEKQGDKPQGKTALEAWKEKKVDNANKVEQKFKVGDWIVEPRKGEHNCIWHIERIEKNSYWEGHVGVFIEHADKYYHLWTIADAKDGDVLISKTKHPFIFKNYDEDTDYVYAYCGITDLVKDNGFYINYEDDELWTMYCVNGDVLPATKEQRDLLFQKMRKAGYEWDAEKKELKLLITNGGDFEQENSVQGA